jgi:NAD(P)-dependent dehydrogenase (short-subunit alcohol dehydrogenase family)
VEIADGTGNVTAFGSIIGRSALITGASSGLGAHFAKVLAKAGMRVAVTARRIDHCQSICEEIIQDGGDATALELDVSVAQSVEAAVQEAHDRFDGLDLLVNNAGVAQTGRFLSFGKDAWDAILDTNLRGAFLVGQAVADRMRQRARGGAIINVASITGLRVAGDLSAYAASKAALIHLTKSMALELARFSIRVNALCPGYFETELNRDFFANDAGRALMGRIPFRRLGRLTELDGPLLLLCSDAGSYMSGSVLVVDGGHLQSSL